MIYLYWYLGIGVVVLVVAYLAHRLSVKKEESNIYAILDPLDPVRDKWHRKLIEKILVPLLTVILMPLMWPVVIYWKAEELILGKPAPSKFEDKVLVVNQSDLIKRISVPEIEVIEMVIDPLGAVPSLPFGHMNTAWEKFKVNAQVEDEIWTFESEWDRGWFKRECRGYAVLRGNEVAHHFMTHMETIEPPPEPPRLHSLS